MNKTRLSIFFIVLVAASFFFVRLFGSTVMRSRASSDPVTVFFEKDTVDAQIDEAVPVNIMVQAPLPASQNKLSGGEMEIAYDANTLEVLESLSNTVDVYCEQNDHLLTQQAQFVVDQSNGTIRLSYVNPTKESSLLPPSRESGMFCFTTVYFKLKNQNPSPTSTGNTAGGGIVSAPTPTSSALTMPGSGNSAAGPTPISALPLTPTSAPSSTSGWVSFNTNPGVCNFVGPSAGYACQFYPSRTTMTITESVVVPTQVPTSVPVPTMVVCKTVIQCAPPANGCSYKNPVVDSSGCQITCGDLVCEPTPTAIPSPTPYCHLASKGDACTCDNVIDILDFEPWRKQYSGEVTCSCADFNRDGACTLNDFETWRQNQT